MNIMKNKMKSLIALLILFLSISAVFSIIAVPYIRSNTAFILGWDMQTIYASNFEGLRNMLRAFQTDHTLPFWSWSYFLGNDFYSSKLFYFNDIYEYFFALTDMKYTEAIIWMTYLRFLTAGFCFYAYSRVNHYSRKTSIIGSLLFAFSAYMLQIMRDPFFAAYVVFLPLYFLAIDLYIMKRKAGFFVFMVFFLFINSYYLFYMTSLFTILYFIWRWDKEYHTMKDMLKNAFILIAYYMVGFLLSGVVTLPEVFNILGNSRVGDRSMTLVYDSLVPYLDYICSLFTPTSIVAYRGSEISNIYLYTTPNHQIMAVYLWSGNICALLVPQLFNKKNYRVINLIILLLATAFSLIPILSSIMHGFSEPSFRWIINLAFLMTAMILPLLEKRKLINNKLLLITMAVYVVLIAGTTPLYANILGIDWADICDEYKLLLYTIPTLLVIGTALYRKWKLVLYLGVIAELSIVSYFTYYGNPTQSNLTKDTADRLTTIMGENNYFNEWTLTLDENNSHEFYRNYIDPVTVYWNQGTNYNLNFNIRGLISYDSTYHSSVNDLLLLDYDHVVDYLPWTFNIQNSDIMTLVSTKYAIVGQGGTCPFTNGELIGHYAEIMDVYENKDYINLGKTYTDVITYDQYKGDTSMITSKIICHTEDYAEIRSLLGSQEVEIEEANANGNLLSAGLNTAQPGFIVISVPYDQGWNTVVNGSSVKTYAVNGGMTGFAIPSGEVDIEMYFTPKGLKYGFYFSISGVCISILLILYTLIRKKIK